MDAIAQKAFPGCVVLAATKERSFITKHLVIMNMEHHLP